ncbi:MAG: hypothetical protein AAFX50_07175 [Acidobacteriota bacterium]
MLSVATLRSYLGVADESHDSLLEILERGVVRQLEEVSGRSFTIPPATQVDTLNVPRSLPGGLVTPGRRALTLTLNEEPTGPLERLEYRVGDSWVEQDRAAFELEGQRVHWVGGGTGVAPWPPGQRSARITYPTGYVVDQGPEDAMLVALQVLGFVWQRRGMGHGVLSAAGLGSNSVKLFEGMPQDLKDAMKALRPSTLGGLV